MGQPGLIASYLAELAGKLPADAVDELGDGLAESRQAFLSRGLSPGDADQAAITEFGEPAVIIAAFTRASPARQAARRLLVIGPAVGGCWAMALIASRAWDWPVPVPALAGLGLALLAVISLLAVAASSRSYLTTARAGRAACAATALLDTIMITAVILVIPALTWPATAAITVSAARIALAGRILLPARIR
jgi:hypothetical protein